MGGRMMPKFKTGLILLTSVFALCLGDVAFSKKHSGGFRESRDSQVETFDIITVEQAKNSKDDTFIVKNQLMTLEIGLLVVISSDWCDSVARIYNTTGITC